MASYAAAVTSQDDSRTPVAPASRSTRQRRAVTAALESSEDFRSAQDIHDALRRGDFAIAGPAFPDFTTMSYIAHFVEVRI